MSDVNVRVGLKDGQFDSGLGKLRGKLGAFKRDQESAFAGLGTKLAGALTFGALAGGVKSLIDFGGALRDSADAVNMNVEALQELHYAFGQSGATGEQVDKALVKLNDSLAAARGGNEAMIASFAKLGVTWEDLHRLTPDELLMKMAAGFKESTDPAAALAAVLDTLGKSGAKMAAGFRQGADELARLRAEASKMSEEEVDKLDAAGDALTKLGNKLKTFFGGGLAGWSEIINPTSGKELEMRMKVGAPASAEDLAAARARADAAKAQREKPVPESPAQAAERKELEKAKKAEADLDEKLAAARRKELQEQIEQGNKLYLEKLEEQKKAREAQEKQLTELRKELIEAETEKRKDELREIIRREEEGARDAERARADERSKFVQGKLDPGAALAKKRAERKEANLERRFGREDALRERGGLSEKDFNDKVRREKIVPRKAVRVEKMDAAKGELSSLQKQQAKDIATIKAKIEQMVSNIGVG